VWLKTLLRRYGGMGYEHLFARVLPCLEHTYGVTPDDVAKMLISTPRRILDRP
jgi:phosphotriesterase-related protein